VRTSKKMRASRRGRSVVRGVRHRLSLSSSVVLLAIPAGRQQPAIVRVGTLELLGGAPLFVAQDRGYFRREGVDVRFAYFGAAAPVATAVSQRAAAGTAVRDRPAYLSRRA
jgi:ABC-type nitrate/sulfonate/bicarbonate transport system substrate-binding protein